MSEPDYSEQLDLEVDDIIENYLAGDFEGEELERVRSYFFRSEARKEKLRLAIALEEYKRRPAANEKAETSEPSTSVVPFPPRRRSLVQYLAIAAVLVVAVSIGYLAIRSSRSNSDVDRGLVALNQAYRQERPLEARLSNFDYAPLPSQRGGKTKVDDTQLTLAGSLLAQAVAQKPSTASHNALGQYYLTERQFDKALDQFNAALALDPNDANTHLNLGAALLEKGKLDSSKTDSGGKAIEELSRSIEHLNKGLELNNASLEGYFNRALAYQFMSLTREAETAWKQYLQKDSNSPWAEEARRNLKTLEENNKRNSRTIDDSLKQFREARQAGNDSAAWKSVSVHYTSAGNEVTNRLLDSFLGLSSDEAASSTTAFADLSYLAEVENKRTGDRYTSDLVTQYGRAGPDLRSRLALARQHANTAYTLFTQTQFTDALSEYAIAEEQYRKAGDTIGGTFMLYRTAHCYVLLSEPEKARRLFQRLLSVSEAKNYRWLAIQGLYGLAHAVGNLKKLSEAIEYSEKALERSEQFGDLNSVVKTLTQLAAHSQALHRGEVALDYLSRALVLASQEHGELFQRWGVFNQIGFSMTAKRLQYAALLYQQQALEIALEMKRPMIIARSYGCVGAAYAALKKYPEAISEVTKGYEAGSVISGTREGRETMAIASWLLGDILRESGQCSKAIETYDRSINLSEELKYEYFSYGAHKGKLFCLSQSGDDQATGNELATTLELFEGYRSTITRDTERNSFFAEEQSVYDLAIDYEFQRKRNPLKAFEYSETSRARTLLDAVRGSTSVRQMSYGPDLSITTGRKSLSLIEIQAQMPADAQILQYAVVNDRFFIWVINKSVVRYEVVNLDASALAEKVRRYLASVSQPPADVNVKSTADGLEMFKLLIAPVERFLDRNKFLCIVPDKILHYLPFDAFVSPSTGGYLVEDYPNGIGVAPSSTLFIDLTNKATRKIVRKGEESFLGVGNPQFDRELFDGLQDLKSAVKEVETVSEFYPRHHPLLVGPGATKNNVKSEIEKSNVIHLAMHYILNGKSEMLSGFPLTPAAARSEESSDGFLSSAEIYDLDLLRTRLALLSACQTGIEQQYDGEGAVSAARPFFVAGVPVVVASLWAVDSDASAQLMIDLHKNRTRFKRPVTQALRQAKLDMLHGQDLRYRHPYYWAPFVVVGGLSTF
ncbi:MAG TPA: CHAT domain-containing protein [Pyrinomonadaceae bacterium]|nr:CHAT domain-containing protein [Pyrinomonadaceae bacterium]